MTLESWNPASTVMAVPGLPESVIVRFPLPSVVTKNSEYDLPMPVEMSMLDPSFKVVPESNVPVVTAQEPPAPELVRAA